MSGYILQYKNAQCICHVRNCIFRQHLTKKLVVQYLVVSSSFPHNPKGLRLGFCLRLCFRLGLGFRLRLRSSFGLTGQRQDLESLNNTGLLDLSEQLCLDT